MSKSNLSFEERKALMSSISLSGGKDNVAEALVQRLGEFTPRESASLAVLKSKFKKYNLIDCSLILDEIILYRSYSKKASKSLIEFKKFASLWDVFNQGNGVLKKGD